MSIQNRMNRLEKAIKASKSCRTKPKLIVTCEGRPIQFGGLSERMGEKHNELAKQA